MSLVEELQIEALKPDVSMTNLLQRASLIASKLNLGMFKSWVRLELDGYRGVPIPEYRKVRGKLSFHNPFHGTCPIILLDAELEAIITLAPVPSPISEIQDLLANARNGNFQYNFPSHIRNQIMSILQDEDVIPFLVVGRHQYQRILEAVKTELLEWSTRLESEGIVGQGVSFSEMEKQKAAKGEEKLTPSIVINIIKTMTNSQIQQHSPAAGQSSS